MEAAWATIEPLVSPFRQELWRAITRIIRDPAESEDLVQEVFLRVFWMFNELKRKAAEHEQTAAAHRQKEDEYRGKAEENKQDAGKYEQQAAEHAREAAEHEQIAEDAKRAIDNLSSAKLLRALLHTIAKRLAIDVFRRRRWNAEDRQANGDDVPRKSLDDFAAPILTVDDRLGLKEALERLPPEELEVIEMMVFEGLTAQEIAEIKGLPLMRVYRLFYSAIRHLREELTA